MKEETEYMLLKLMTEILKEMKAINKNLEMINETIEDVGFIDFYDDDEEDEEASEDMEINKFFNEYLIKGRGIRYNGVVPHSSYCHPCNFNNNCNCHLYFQKEDI